MRHFLINVLWPCNLKCSYCWVEHTVRARPEQFRSNIRPCEDWVRAINRDSIELVDIAGGEPLLLDWIPDLIEQCPRTTFGLSTNGLRLDNLIKLAERGPRNLCNVNISLHIETLDTMPDYLERYAVAVNTLRGAGVRTSASVVAANDNVDRTQHAVDRLREAGVHVSISPYEDSSTLGELVSQGLTCDGGVTHLSLAPNGDAWPCLTTMRSPMWAETCLGNWIDGTIDLSRKPKPCHLQCVDYYTLPTQHEAGDMWLIHAKPWDGKEPSE